MGDLKAFMNQMGFDSKKTKSAFIVEDNEEEEEEEEQQQEEDEEEEEEEEEEDIEEEKVGPEQKKLKEQLKKLITNPDLDENELENEDSEGKEKEGGKSDVAAKAKKIFIAPQTAWWELSNTEKTDRKPRELSLEKQTKRAEDLMKRQVTAFEKSAPHPFTPLPSILPA